MSGRRSLDVVARLGGEEFGIMLPETEASGASQVVEGVAYDIPDPAASKGEAREIIRELVEMVRNGAGKIYPLVETK